MTKEEKGVLRGFVVNLLKLHEQNLTIVFELARLAQWIDNQKESE